MPSPQLVYFADPMCSWCWGFSPTIEAIAAEYGASLPIRVIVGGLRPGTTKAMDAAARATSRGHWERVHEASGQPFDFAFFDRKHFVYDTEPAARAVVVMRGRDEALALPFHARVQRAFYAENRDVTDADVLAELAAEFGYTAAAFGEAFDSDRAREETQGDFRIAQSTGITGFPTLIAGYGDERPWTLITQGFQPKDRILPVVEEWLEGVALPSA